jgi:hypothetical protein
MGRFQNLIGQNFGRLNVLYRAHTAGRTRWVCRCSCGQQTTVMATKLQQQRTKSCGCLNREMTIERNLKHGCNKRGAKTPEYDVWQRMKRRCYNSRDNRYKYYGARGIRVCKRWKNNFQNFLADMGTRPDGCTSNGYPAYVIDRIDNNDNYTPANCRWATLSESVKNRRDLTSSETPRRS